MSQNRILVTGATGFVGTPLTRRLLAAGYRVRVATRVAGTPIEAHGHPGQLTVVTVGPIGPTTGWDAALEGVDAVVHLAGKAHVFDVHGDDATRAEYASINTAGTLALARTAAATGVRRMVFLSTVRVYGGAVASHVLTERDPATADDPYGESKRRAEEGLRSLAAAGELEPVILRAPPVYGPGVKANFLRLIGWVARGIPLPLGLMQNRRSFLYVENLVDAILASLGDAQAAGQTFLVSDGRSLSTADLVRLIAAELQRAPRLPAVPPRLLELLARWSGRAEDYQRLCGNLEVDSSLITERIGYQPRFSTAEGIAATVRWYLAQQGMTPSAVGSSRADHTRLY